MNVSSPLRCSARRHPESHHILWIEKNATQMRNDTHLVKITKCNELVIKKPKMRFCSGRKKNSGRSWNSRTYKISKNVREDVKDCSGFKKQTVWEALSHIISAFTEPQAPGQRVSEGTPRDWSGVLRNTCGNRSDKHGGGHPDPACFVNLSLSGTFYTKKTSCFKKVF